MAQQVVRRSALIDAATIKIAAIIYMPEMRQRVSQRHHAAEVYRFGYVGNRRYLKLRAAFSGTHATGTPIAALVIKGHGRVSPQADQG